MERTLAIVKPDAVAQSHTGAILALIEKAGFRIAGLRKIRLTREQAERFYAVHRERSFFAPLVAFMTEAPVVVMVLEKENAIADWRTLMGVTDPAKAADGTIRKLYATNIERNAVHGSDAPGPADVEVAFFFRASELL